MPASQTLQTGCVLWQSSISFLLCLPSRHSCLSHKRGLTNLTALCQYPSHSLFCSRWSSVTASDGIGAKTLELRGTWLFLQSELGFAKIRNCNQPKMYNHHQHHQHEPFHCPGSADTSHGWSSDARDVRSWQGQVLVRNVDSFAERGGCHAVHQAAASAARTRTSFEYTIKNQPVCKAVFCRVYRMSATRLKRIQKLLRSGVCAHAS